MEEVIESRLVTPFRRQVGDAAHGPLRVYDHLGEENWTVLVQACKPLGPEVNELALPFQFIPAGALTT